MMDTASLQFVGFGLIAALLVNLNRSRVWRSAILLLASLAFLFLLARSTVALLPLAGFLILGYASILLLKQGKIRLVSVLVVIVVLTYACLKKYTFLPESSFISHPYFTLGLSYIFFRVLHLIIEVGDGADQPSLSIGTYLLYTLNFTTLVSGPIQRYDDFARDQFAAEPLPLGPRVIGLQVERIIRGFVKVNVIAMFLYAAQQDALSHLSQPLPLSARLLAAFELAVIYPFFLYSNFSGYIDIVIGLARLMRIRLTENFNRPFSADSFIEFWSRWHITLSLWLKTYVYNPLLMALMRRIESPALVPYLGVVSFFVTFFLVGIWHGRTSEFLVFGILQGGGVAVNKLWQVWLTKIRGRKGYRELAAQPLYIAFGRGLTFTWFALTLFWFWASWQQLHVVLHGIGMVQWCCVWFAVWIVATAVLATWETVRAGLLSLGGKEAPILVSRYARVVYASAFALVAFVLSVLLNHPAPDLVYKAF